MNKILNFTRYAYRTRKEVRQKYRNAIAIVKTRDGWTVVLPQRLEIGARIIEVEQEWISASGIMRRVIAFSSNGLPVTESADGIISKWEERLMDEVFHKLVK